MPFIDPQALTSSVACNFAPFIYGAVAVSFFTDSLLFHQSAPIPLHALAALLAIVLGGIQLCLEKGTLRHRLCGWLWVCLMVVVAVSSFFIHEIKLWGRWSPIHLLSLWTIFSLGLAIYYAQIGKIHRHRQVMRALYVFALILTGFFTLLPGRVMYQVVFG